MQSQTTYYGSPSHRLAPSASFGPSPCWIAPPLKKPGYGSAHLCGLVLLIASTEMFSISKATRTFLDFPCEIYLSFYDVALKISTFLENVKLLETALSRRNGENGGYVVLFAVVVWRKGGSISLAQVVQKLDSAIHRINRYPEEKYYENQLCYPVNSAIRLSN